MNSENIILFIIFLLGIIILFSFLGEINSSKIEQFTGSFSGEIMTKNGSNKIIDISGNFSNGYSNNQNYDNYNHFSGSSSSLINGNSFYGPNGGSVVVNTQSDGTTILKVILQSGEASIVYKSYNSDSHANVQRFYGPDGGVATVINYKGYKAIKIKTSKADYIFISSNTQNNNNNNNNNNQIKNNYTKYNNTPNTYYGSTGDIYSASSFANNAYTGPDIPTTNNQPNNILSSLFNNNSEGIYNSSLPQGIPRSQIVPGQEDLYILKSEIVPPVCPACPAYPINNAPNKQEKCPPCPACARCPEPSFECKKVPNYNAVNNQYLPIPVISDFSSFGM